MIEYFVKKHTYRQIGDKEAKTVFVAKLDEKTILDTEELCQRVADCSTLAKPEMRLAIDMACDMIIEALKGGRSVRFGELGVFHPTINAVAQEKKEDVTVQTIKKITCAFRMSNKLKKTLNNLHLRKIVPPNSEE